MYFSELIPLILAFNVVFSQNVRPNKNYKDVPIIAFESNLEEDGRFHYHYESGDGTKANQDGYLKQNAPEGPGEVMQGSFSYIGDDGITYSISYTADENGFQAQGAHIPTPPPIPDAILKALQILPPLSQSSGGGGATSYQQPAFGGNRRNKF